MPRGDVELLVFGYDINNLDDGSKDGYENFCYHRFLPPDSYGLLIDRISN